MPSRKLSSFSYYFLNKRLHPPPPPGYRASTVLFIVNCNPGLNYQKFLFIKETGQQKESWGLPKEGLESSTVVDDIITSIARNLEEELGLRGMKISEMKPAFHQRAIYFDFAVQRYDPLRSGYEAMRKRPTKGKVYHLAIMDYTGPDKIPLDGSSGDTSITDFLWVEPSQAQELTRKTTTTFYPMSAEFNISLLNQVLLAYKNLPQNTSQQGILL